MAKEYAAWANKTLLIVAASGLYLSGLTSGIASKDDAGRGWVIGAIILFMAGFGAGMTALRDIFASVPDNQSSAHKGELLNLQERSCRAITIEVMKRFGRTFFSSSKIKKS